MFIALNHLGFSDKSGMTVDATSIPGSPPQAGTDYGAQVSTFVAILCERRSAVARRRDTRRPSRVRVSIVSIYFIQSTPHQIYSTDLLLDKRLEYLTLAVGNAKSHPVTIGGRHETAISFLTNLEEKLDVAQAQLEVYNALSPHMNDPGEAGEKIKYLSKTLLTMSEVCPNSRSQSFCRCTFSAVSSLCGTIRSTSHEALDLACL